MFSSTCGARSAREPSIHRSHGLHGLLFVVFGVGHVARRAQIADFGEQLIFGREQNVARRNVAMNQLVGVQVCQSVGRIERNMNHLLFAPTRSWIIAIQRIFQRSADAAQRRYFLGPERKKGRPVFLDEA